MNGDAVSDASLWLEAVAGTESAFAVLFDRHRARIFRKAYSRLRSVHDAEDVVAMVFLEAWRSREKVRIVDGSLLPWLLSVTTYLTLNSDRAARRYRRLLAKLPIAPAADPVPDVDDRLDLQERANILTQALRRLSAVERTVVDLCLVEELSMATVAGVLDVPIGTVKSRLNGARRKLRTYLGESDITVRTAGELTSEGISG
ncbi:MULTISPECIES: RNA polymerase sigma factor [unclassified Cryobacterium]|uniref:RNA polymerase sigma factor n=1 Tax=unclassified Cryobacterium TaxID=2649013 RepID=UPI00141A950C|nr:MULTISPECIES: RNA polymerase sigma factor [unclassified Cryobacterium]